jgi:DNA modification methylase
MKILNGDAREMIKQIADKSIQCCVTSPPYYGLRDYGTARWEGGHPNCDHMHVRKKTTRGGPHSTLAGGQKQEMHQTQYRNRCEKCGAVRIDAQIGLEDTPEKYIDALVTGVFRPLRGKLRDDGTLWIVIGDSYASTWSCGRRNTVGADACDYGSRQVRTGNGIKEKDLIGIPWMLAFALRADGWYLRSEIIWEKPSAMPESVGDRPTRAHEQIFLLSKSPTYYFDSEAIREPLAEGSIKRLSQPNLANQYGSDRAHAGVKSSGPMKPVVKRSGNKERKFRSENGGNPESDSNMGYAIPWEDDGSGRNKRTVWNVDEELFAQFLTYLEEQAAKGDAKSVVTIASKPYRDAHFATYPPDLIEPMILASSSRGDVVLDPFCGSGTTGLVCSRLERDFIGIELKHAYAEMSERRIRNDAPLFAVFADQA